MNSGKVYFLTFPVVFILAACATAALPRYGIQDDAIASSIRRVNLITELRSSQRYSEALLALENDAKNYVNSSYAYPRILNEMAELYSLQILDLESAIEIDEKIKTYAISDQDDSNFRPRHQTANQTTIADANYISSFVNVDGASLKKRASERLQVNRQLVTGRSVSKSKSYTVERLNQHLLQVQEDVDSTPINSPARRRILSRLIRGEYELQKLRPNTKLQSWREIERGQINLGSVDLSEIDFLSLADYFVRVFKQTGNITYAEYALQTIYRPYVNLRSSQYRWQYNKLINEYVGMLIEANYQAGRYDDMLYYASLNKSRMLLEERLAFAKNGANAKVSDLLADDGIPRTAAGLPEKAWFQRKLAATDGYLDFYISGHYDTQKASVSKVDFRTERSTMPLTTRDFGVEAVNEKEDVFVDDALYVMRVEGGRVVSAKKTLGTKLSSLKSELDSSYRQISNPREGKAPISRQLQELAGGSRKQLMVSPDKWMARHPLDYHLDAPVTRSVNFFTAADQGKVRDLRASGFFNPTLDLPGAEQEAEAMRTVLPSLQVFTREQATLSALEHAADASIVHLSMHGQFNADEPTSSRLAFAGARSGRGVLSDPNSLYAKDMYKYAALKDRDLVFAAACQAGLSVADQSNQSELMGILRPLTANRNRNIILSLWNVNDAATRDFVGSFYKHLAANRDVAKSFHAAQDELRQKYPDPYYWAAFYLAQAR